MTVSIGIGMFIAVMLLVLVVLSNMLELWGERIRRQTQRERWRKPNNYGRNDRRG